jgi:hypothetical protein
MCLGYLLLVPVKAPTPDSMALDDALTLLLNIIWRCNNQVCDEDIQVLWVSLQYNVDQLKVECSVGDQMNWICNKCMFLGDLDPLVRGTDPDPSIIKQK